MAFNDSNPKEMEMDEQQQRRQWQQQQIDQQMQQNQQQQQVRQQKLDRQWEDEKDKTRREQLDADIYEKCMEEQKTAAEQHDRENRGRDQD